MVMSSAISLVLTAVMVLFPDELIRIFNSDLEVIRIGAQYLLIVSSFYLAFSGMFITGGILRGAGDTFIQMIITLAALWIIRIPVSALLSKWCGTSGIWWGIPVGWMVGFIASLVYYMSGRWKRKVLVGPASEQPSSAEGIAP
jgi:Na+-driven multidrug efflux pump